MMSDGDILRCVCGCHLSSRKRVSCGHSPASSREIMGSSELSWVEGGRERQEKREGGGGGGREEGRGSEGVREEEEGEEGGGKMEGRENREEGRGRKREGGGRGRRGRREEGSGMERGEKASYKLSIISELTSMRGWILSTL